MLFYDARVVSPGNICCAVSRLGIGLGTPGPPADAATWAASSVSMLCCFRSLRARAGRELHIAYGRPMETAGNGTGIAGMLSFTGAHETRAAQYMRLPAPRLTCGWCPGKAGQQSAVTKLPSSPGSEQPRAAVARVARATAVPLPILTTCRQLCSGCCRCRCRRRRCYCCSLCM